MGLFDISEERKRAKEIRKAGKELRKEFLAAGLEKKFTEAFLEEYLPCIERACSEQKAYRNARARMMSCMQMVEDMIPQMRELSLEECKKRLEKLLDDLAFVYHDCLVRKDDMDFDTTFQYMKRTIPVYGADDRLMMQSELENLRAVFYDASLWNAPEFVALAYFLQHGNSEELAEMENSQRNNYVEHFYKDQFWDRNEESIERAGMRERVLQFEEQMLAK